MQNCADRGRGTAPLCALMLVVLAACSGSSDDTSPQADSTQATVHESSTTSVASQPTVTRPSTTDAESTSTTIAASTSSGVGPGAPPDATFGLMDAIRERAFVTNGRDDDGDGRPDQFTVDIVRPNTDQPVPVIMVQSPYWDNGGRGREHEKRERDENGVVVSMPLFYDNWFVPRGYAFVALDALEYGSAGGCDDSFGPASTASSVAALDWLSGAGQAVDVDGTEVQAAWSNGNVAMIGKSADGGLAVAAAATGHPALKAVVSIEGVTNLLERGTGGGLLSGPVPTPEWFEVDPECHDYGERFIAEWGDGFHYTDFWRDRDPTGDMSAYTAATFVVNGFADLNVSTSQAKLLWDALRDHDVPRKMWLHQAGHEDPFDLRRAEWVDELSRFFDHYLRGDSNGVDTEPAVTVQNPDGTWTHFDDWVPPGSTTTWVWRDGVLTASDASMSAAPPSPIGEVQRDAADAPAPAEGFMDFWLGDPSTARPYRLTLTSEPLSGPLTILGEPTVTASFKMTGARYGIVATLIDLGPGERIDPEGAVFGADLIDAGTESCWGASTPTDDACYPDTTTAFVPTEYGIIATGGSGIERATFRDDVTSVPDGQWVTATIGLGMANTTIEAGHRLAVVFTASSLVFPDVPSTRTVTVGSDLQIALPQPP